MYTTIFLFVERELLFQLAYPIVKKSWPCMLWLLTTVHEIISIKILLQSIEVVSAIRRSFGSFHSPLVSLQITLGFSGLLQSLIIYSWTIFCLSTDYLFLIHRWLPAVGKNQICRIHTLVFLYLRIRCCAGLTCDFMAFETRSWTWRRAVYKQEMIQEIRKSAIKDIPAHRGLNKSPFQENVDTNGHKSCGVKRERDAVKWLIATCSQFVFMRAWNCANWAKK